MISIKSISKNPPYSLSLAPCAMARFALIGEGPDSYRERVRLDKRKVFRDALKKYLPLFFLLVWLTTYAQDIHFSQTFNTPMVLNPSFCGDFKGQVRAVNAYKQQWSSISDKPYKTFLFSVDMPMLEKKINAGLIFFNDKQGDSEMSTTQADLVVSSQVSSTENNKILAGLQVGFGQRKFDGKNLVWDSQWNGSSFSSQLPSNEPVLSASFGYADLSAGVGWNHTINSSSNLRIGFGAYHLNTPAFSFIYKDKESLNMKFVLSGMCEAKFKGSSNTSYVYSFTWMNQGTANEINFSIIARQILGMNSIYTGNNVSSNLLFGAMFRKGDALAPYIGYEHKNGLSAGVSYDINFSGLKVATYARGGFEFHLAYRFLNKNITVETIAPKS